jgi:hypothetical protein
VLRTHSPLSAPIAEIASFDLHVLSTPPAFILSQDQTLRKNCFPEYTPRDLETWTALAKANARHWPIGQCPSSIHSWCFLSLLSC